MYVARIIIMVIYIVTIDQVSAKSSVCTWRGNYWSVQSDGKGICSPCSKCPAGKYMRARCTKQADTRCVRCRHGYFSLGGFKKKCTKCRKPVCEKGFRYIGCKKYRNAACVPCKKNYYYLHPTNECKRCSVCPPGHYVSSLCGLHNDTVCKPCPGGTFRESSNLQLYCSACTLCRLGEQTIRECTADRNTVCGGCSAGYFRIQSSYECEKCSMCYRDYPDTIIEIDECRRNDNNSDRICMPVAYPPYGYQDYEEYDYELLVKTSELPVSFAEDFSDDLILVITFIIGGVVVILLIGLIVFLSLVYVRKRRRQGKEPKKLLPNTSNDKVEKWLTNDIDSEAMILNPSNSEPMLSCQYPIITNRNSYPTTVSPANYFEDEQLLSPVLDNCNRSESEFNFISVSKDDLPTANANESTVHESDENESVVPRKTSSARTETDVIFTIESKYNSITEDTLADSSTDYQVKENQTSNQVKDNQMCNVSTPDTGYFSTRTTQNIKTTQDYVQPNVAFSEPPNCAKVPAEQQVPDVSKQNSASENGFDQSHQSTSVVIHDDHISIQEHIPSILPQQAGVNVQSVTSRELNVNSSTDASKQSSPLAFTASDDLIDLDSECNGASTIYVRNQNDANTSAENRTSSHDSRYSAGLLRSNRGYISDERCHQNKCLSLGTAYEDLIAPARTMQQLTEPRTLYYSESQLDTYSERSSFPYMFTKHIEYNQSSCKCRHCCVTQSP